MCWILCRQHADQILPNLPTYDFENFRSFRTSSSTLWLDSVVEHCQVILLRGRFSVNVQCDTVKDFHCRCRQNKFAHASLAPFFASLLPLLIRFYRLVFDIDIRSDWWSDFGRLQWSTLSLLSSSSILACHLHVNVLKRKEFLVAYDSWKDQRKRKVTFRFTIPLFSFFSLGSSWQP